jgi:hypothetical protein
VQKFQARSGPNINWKAWRKKRKIKDPHDRLVAESIYQQNGQETYSNLSRLNIAVKSIVKLSLQSETARGEYEWLSSDKLAFS